MALLPTLLAIGIGIALGLHRGGRVGNLLEWQPPLWQALAGGVGLLAVLDLLPVGGAPAAFLRVVGVGALLTFAVVNVRIGGMVLIVFGMGLNLVVTVLNRGMPVNGAALVHAGFVRAADLGTVQLTGGRELADGAVLGFLGGTIALPWGHVISVGDVVVLFGIALVTASVTRRYQVGGGSSNFGRSHRLSDRGGPGDYRSALDALGRGPAPRRGPGLHPSRLTARTGSWGRPTGRGMSGRRTPPGRGPGSGPR